MAFKHLIGLEDVSVKDIDFLLMESTYGGREHELGTGADDRIAEILDKAIKRGGELGHGDVRVVKVSKPQQDSYPNRYQKH